MRSELAVIAPTSIRLDFNFLSQIKGNNPLVVAGLTFVNVSTSSVDYQQLGLVQYSVEVDGVINVTDINLNLITRNDSNCNSRLQISGDGGNTFADITDDIPGDGATNFVMKGAGQWISNIQIGTNKLRVRLLVRSIDGNAATARFRVDSGISIVYNKITTGALLSTPQFTSTIGRGFVSGGRSGVNLSTNERFDDVANTWTARTGVTARRNIAGYSFFLTDFGFTSGGFTTVDVGTTERFDDVANTQTAVTSITARSGAAGFAISLPAKPLPDMFGYTSCGISGVTNLGTTERYDNVANTQTARANATARRFVAGYSMFGAGFTSCGVEVPDLGTTERLDDIANTWTARANATVLFGRAGYSLNEFGIPPYPDLHPFGFTSGGSISGGAVQGTTERFDDFANTHTARTSITARYRLAGFSMLGFGFTSCGFDSASVATGETQRFDDLTNTQTARTSATARDSPGGYSLEEYFIRFPVPVGNGFTSCGFFLVDVGITERFDDATNVQVSRSPATSREELAGYSLSGFGFTSCGDLTGSGVSTGLTERFDDTVNNHTARASATARRRLAGYSFGGFGFTSCGRIDGNVGTTERFDNSANTHTARADATARRSLAGYSFGGFGFTSCGSTTVDVGTTERYDNAGNTHTARASATPRAILAGYAFGGFGFTSCGLIGAAATGTTERFDDAANIHTPRADAIARTVLAGYAFGGFGFTSCGLVSGVNQGVTQKFDDASNTHTIRANASQRQELTGYAI